MIRHVNFSEAHEILTSRPNAVLLDVRDEAEYITGHALDSILLPNHEIDEDLAADAIPTYDTPVLVYCRSGRRSAEAARKLDEYGYTEIYDIGSLAGWPYGLV